MDPLSIATAAGGLIKGITGLFQKRKANKIKIPEVNYEISPYAKQIQGEANRLKNSRMAGYDIAADNIAQSQANATGAIGRNATSGAQALQMLAAAQMASNSAYGNLSQQQGQYAMNMLQNWNNANQGMVVEGDKKYQSDRNNQMMKLQEKMMYMGAGMQNFGQGLNDLGTAAAMQNFGKGLNDLGTAAAMQWGK